MSTIAEGAQAHRSRSRLLAERVRAERESRGMSLDALARTSGVSRSMLHAVERGQKSPTVHLLDKIATGLGTSIARLVETEQVSRVVLLRKGEQAVLRDPAGWERRILSPTLPGVEFELMRTTIAPHVDAGIFNPHAPGSREYVAVECGELQLILNDASYVLEAGDAIYYDGNCRHGFRNVHASDCTYYLAMDVTARTPHVGHA